MKGFNVAEIFCELLSGFAAIFLVIVLLDVFGTSCLRQSLTLIVSKGSATAIAGAVLVAYLVGLVVDAVGLAVGGWFLDSWLCQEPSSDEKEKDGFLVCKESEPAARRKWPDSGLNTVSCAGVSRSPMGLCQRVSESVNTRGVHWFFSMLASMPFVGMCGSIMHRLLGTLVSGVGAMQIRKPTPKALLQNNQDRMAINCSAEPEMEVRPASWRLLQMRYRFGWQTRRQRSAQLIELSSYQLLKQQDRSWPSRTTYPSSRRKTYYASNLTSGTWSGGRASRLEKRQKIQLC